MIPTENTLLNTEFEIVMHPDKTYFSRMNEGRIRGFAEDRDAIIQAIFKVLNTERSFYSAYSENYGIELLDLYGMPISYVLPELKRRITEALIWDDRIESVDHFEFVLMKGKIGCTFTAHTLFGEVEFEKVVEI